jgi:UDP-N-acetylglucosamine 2-epimerase (non-hydrolysing)
VLESSAQKCSQISIALIIGTRPKAIKLAPVALALAASGWARSTIITTGQHGDVVRETLNFFDLKAEIELAAPEQGGFQRTSQHGGV